MMAAATAPKLQPDLAEIRRALDLLVAPGCVVELRAFTSRKVTMSGYYSDLDRAAHDAVAMNRTAKGVYLVANEIDPALLARRSNRHEERPESTTNDDQVVRRRWLLVDIDPTRPAGISATDAQHDAALQRCDEIAEWLMGEYTWPAPIRADSGNGGHLVWRIDLPNDADAEALVKGCLAALQSRFGSDALSVDQTVSNAARIWKLYGTVTRKGDNTAERPHRLSRLLTVPDEIEIVSREQLAGLAAIAPKPEPKPQCAGRGPDSFPGMYGDGKWDVDALLRQHGIGVVYSEAYACTRGRGRKWVLERCVWNPDHADKSAFLIQWDSGAVSAGCSHNTCQGKGWLDFKAALGIGSRRREQGGADPPRPQSTSSSSAGAKPTPEPERDVRRVKVEVGSLNGRGNRRVVQFLFADKRHVEAIDPFDAHARQQAIHRAAGALAVKSSQIAGADLEIVRLAEEDEDRDKQVDFRSITCAELDAGDYALDYLIDRTLVDGQGFVLAGPKKSLKTSLLVDMGIALATGGFFLGKLPVLKPCRVGIMSGESGMATIQETARRICHAAGKRLPEITNLVFSDRLPMLENEAHLDALKRFIMDNGLRVLGIDPAYLCMSGSEAGNLFIQGAVLRRVNELCAEVGCTPGLAHHTRKGGKADPFSPPELEDIAWAGFQEWARQWLLVGRRERYEPGTGEHRLWLNVGGSAGHSALWALDISEGACDGATPRHWQVSVSYAEEARQQARQAQETQRTRARAEKDQTRLEADRGAVVAAMVKLGAPESRNGIRQRVGIGHSPFDRAWASLLSDGTIREAGVGRRGNIMAALYDLTPDGET